MADLGLRARPTKRFPARPVSLEQLRQMLATPYHTGVLQYQGALYPGRHESIVDGALFDRVPEVADLRSRRGSRDHVHEHVLEGMLFCGRCQKAGREHRPALTEGKGRGGSYYYFLCRDREKGVCDLPYLRVEGGEDAFEREYANLAPSSREERLVDLAAEGALSVAQVRSRPTTLQQDRDRVRQQLDNVEQDLAEGADALTAA